MPEPWHITPDPTGLCAGRIVHDTYPRFTASWASGPELLTDIDGLHWSDAGAGEDDSLQIYAFQWTDDPPDQTAFESLMREAVNAIDAWIAERC